MNDIASAAILISLSLLSLAAIGWSAIPKPERGGITEVSASQWVAITATGARVLSRWGPRLDFDAPASAVAPSPREEPCIDGSPFRCESGESW